MTADVEMLPELVAEGLDFFNLAGDEGDKLYVRAIRQHIAAKDAEIEALRAEVVRLRRDRDDCLAAREHYASLYGEQHGRAERLAEALRVLADAFESRMADEENPDWHECWNNARALLREQEAGR